MKPDTEYEKNGYNPTYQSVLYVFQAYVQKVKMAPEIQNFDTKIRSLTAKNTLFSVEIQKYAPKLP